MRPAIIYLLHSTHTIDKSLLEFKGIVMVGQRTVLSRAKMLDRMVNELLIEVITIKKSRCL